MSVLAEVAAAAHPELRAHALADPGPELYADVADADRRFVLEAIREGYEMHYGTPRVFAEVDEDLRLLAGDALYALGLSRLAERGDLEAVAELADLISLCARLHAEDRGPAAEQAWHESAARLAL